MAGKCIDCGWKGNWPEERDFICCACVGEIRVDSSIQMPESEQIRNQLRAWFNDTFEELWAEYGWGEEPSFRLSRKILREILDKQDIHQEEEYAAAKLRLKEHDDREANGL